MDKKNKIKLSFRKKPKNTGLFAIGTPYNSTDIKINKVTVGEIMPPSWNSSNKGWKIGFMVIKKDIMEDGNKNCVWKWVRFKVEFEKEELGRIWVRDNIEGIMSRYELYLGFDGGG